MIESTYLGGGNSVTFSKHCECDYSNMGGGLELYKSGMTYGLVYNARSIYLKLNAPNFLKAPLNTLYSNTYDISWLESWSWKEN